MTLPRQVVFPLSQPSLKSSLQRIGQFRVDSSTQACSTDVRRERSASDVHPPTNVAAWMTVGLSKLPHTISVVCACKRCLQSRFYNYAAIG
jgi:hypothetical protein